jgi:hypothetical protein
MEIYRYRGTFPQRCLVGLVTFCYPRRLLPTPSAGADSSFEIQRTYFVLPNVLEREVSKCTEKSGS